MSIKDVKVVESKDDIYQTIEALCNAVNIMSNEISALRTDVDKLVENARRRV